MPMDHNKFQRTFPIRLLYPALLFCGTAAVAYRTGQANQFGETLRHSIPIWIILAFILQILFIINLSFFYWIVYRLAGLSEKVRHLFLLVLAASFVAAVIPAGTISGAGLMVYDAGRRGLNTSLAILANLVFYILDYLAFLIVLAIALIFLLSSGAIQKYQEDAAGIMLVLVIAALALLVLTCARPTVAAGLAFRLIRPLGKLFTAPAANRLSVWEEKLHALTASVAKAGQAAWKGKRALVRAGLHAVLVEVIGLFQLFSLFMAYGYTPGPGQIIAGYAVGVLFSIVSITPNGVGIMEGAMTAAFVSTGVPIEHAVLATFSFRALNFWLPVMAGFPAARKVML